MPIKTRASFRGALTAFTSFYAFPLLALMASAPVAAQVHNSMQGRSFKLASENMVYRLFVPKDYSASRKYPLMVAMHGVGEKGNDNNIQVDREDLASTWIADSLQARVPHFVMVPQCPSDLSWGSSVAIKGVHDIIDSLKREFSLDTNRIYVAGLSMGGRGTFNLLQMKPGMFAAALPCAGAGDTSAAGSIAKTPIWAFHSDTDPTVDVAGSRDMVGAMERRGIKFVRFLSQAYVKNPGMTTYTDAIKSGVDPVSIVAKSPTPPVTYDSLRRALAGKAEYLYSEVLGGDHRTGWMVAFHHPLVTGWIYSHVKGSASVTLAPPPHAGPARARTEATRRIWNGAVLVFGDPSESAAGSFTADGRGALPRFP